jgi:hypothetical protein
MHSRRIGVIVSGTAMVVAHLALGPRLSAQRPGAEPTAGNAGKTIPRRPDGRPDLQGVWTNFDRTPLEAPSSDDIARLMPLDTWFPGLAAPPEQRTIRGPNPAPEFNDSSGKRSPLRRSLVVDPSDGRVPIRPEAVDKRAYYLAHLTDTWAHHTPWERCITRGVPGGMLPAGYNNAYRFVQNADTVAIVYEMLHEPRVIPLNGRPHLSANIRLWNGASRGHWEGDTLVVEVTNYRAEEVGTVATGISTTATLKGVAQSEAMRVVERFTLVDVNTIQYEATIEDPRIYTRPWKVALPLNRDEDYEIGEYACHEGNYGLRNSLSGARVREGTLKSGDIR